MLNKRNKKNAEKLKDYLYFLNEDTPIKLIKKGKKVEEFSITINGYEMILSIPYYKDNKSKSWKVKDMKYLYFDKILEDSPNNYLKNPIYVKYNENNGEILIIL